MNDLSEKTDQELVEMFQATTGMEREKAFSELYTRYEQKLRWYLGGLTENDILAGDLTQKTFLKALNGLESFKGTSSFKNWLYRIATNTWRNYIKKNRPTPTDVEEEDRYTRETPDRQVERDEKIEVVRKKIEELPEKFRAPLLLVRFEDMSYREAGNALDLSTDAIRMRVHRARQQLEDKLEGIQ